ncbi:MAG: signal peptide peptidase SppA, partial [Bacteroidetes bacterium]
MKDFFKFMLASMLGFILVIVIVFFISLGLIIGLMSFVEQKDVVVKENTVLRIDFKNPIPERTPKHNIFAGLTSGSFKTILGLNDILRNISDAKADDRVKGIILNLNIVPSGISTLEEIRVALLDFKESGKFILCYGEYMTQGAYYIGSVADEMYLHPQGFVDFKGLNAQLMFFKGMLDKLDIKMQIVRHGKFKSAVEPLIQEEMSPENREQYTAFITSIWNSILAQISASRGLSVGELNSIADGLIAYDAEDAVSSGLIDKLTFRDEYRQILADRLMVDDLDDISIITLSQYDRVMKSFSITGDRIAVIYATGQIGGGQGSNEEIGADKFAETIARVRKDDNIKAVVLRVNSPGGDALASDIIWRELELCQAVKPVIVSMGDVAASGGYWISCASEKILADPTTLTGSIGVFGVIPDFGDFMENKIGITYDRVGTNDNSGFPSVVRPLTSYERKVLQNKVEDVYDLFLARVSNNRDMSKDEVDKIGEGRVWSGVDALKLGLVDELGGLYDAIDMAAEISGLEEYRMLELPVLKDPIDQLIEEL